MWQPLMYMNKIKKTKSFTYMRNIYINFVGGGEGGTIGYSRLETDYIQYSFGMKS